LLSVRRKPGCEGCRESRYENANGGGLWVPSSKISTTVLPSMRNAPKMCCLGSFRLDRRRGSYTRKHGRLASRNQPLQVVRILVEKKVPGQPTEEIRKSFGRRHTWSSSTHQCGDNKSGKLLGDQRWGNRIHPEGGARGYGSWCQSMGNGHAGDGSPRAARFPSSDDGDACAHNGGTGSR